MSHYQRAYHIVLYSILCIVSVRTIIMLPADRKVSRGSLEQKSQECNCIDCNKLWFRGWLRGKDHPFSQQEKEVAEALVQLPIAIHSVSKKGASKHAFPLIELIYEYCPQWLLCHKITLDSSWVSQGCVPRIGYTTMLNLVLGGPRTSYQWHYLNDPTIVFENKGIEQLKAMIGLLENNAVEQKFKGFEIEFEGSTQKTIFTVDTVGYSQKGFEVLDVAPRLYAYLKAKKK